LVDLNIPPQERISILETFRRHYIRSLDYDLAAASAFDAVTSIAGKSFHKKWRELNKQEKGDTVKWQGAKYIVEDVREDFKNGKNLYTICRMESADGLSLKLNCVKILADEGELETA
jgi:hypothetical protein